jgi:hypothetical protein
MGSISNDFSRFVVINLHDEHPGRGPYVVAQTATDPEDSSFTERDYVLSRQADWVDWVEVISGPPELFDEVIFDEIKQMLEVIDQLVGPARIRRINSDETVVAMHVRSIEDPDGLRSLIRRFLREREERLKD